MTPRQTLAYCFLGALLYHMGYPIWTWQAWAVFGLVLAAQHTRK